MTKIVPSTGSDHFSEVLKLIREGRSRALRAVNVALIDTNWAVGQLLSVKAAEAGWQRGTVQELANWLSITVPDLRGYSASNLWRMKQFYDAYRYEAILAPLVRELPWTHNLIILSQTKSDEEKEFYLPEQRR